MLLTGCYYQKVTPAEDFTYEFIDGEVMITGYTGSELDIVIPEMIEKRTVTIIGEEAFKGYDMNSIILPKTLVTVKKDAFYGCKKLKEIVFPESVTEVFGEYCLSDCENLESIHLPDTLKTFECELRGTPWYENQPDGVIYIDNVCFGFKGEDYPDSLEIKSGTKSIIRLFQGFVSDVPRIEKRTGMNFTDIYIPESVENIAPKSVGYYTKQQWNYGIVSGQLVNHDFTIHGKTGTCAETYAKDNNITFLNTDKQGVAIDGNYLLADTNYHYATIDEMIASKNYYLVISGNNALLQTPNGTQEMKVDTNKQTIADLNGNNEESYMIDEEGRIIIEDMIFEKQ